MNITERLKKLRDDVIISMSKVSCGHISTEEKRIKDELNAKLNYDEPDRLTKQNNKSRGQVDSLTIREISNGEDRYSVKDLLYSYHYEGRTDAWQYGIRAANKDVEFREFSVTKGEKTSTLTLKKEKGSYHEYGDSQDSGNFNHCIRTFSEYSAGTVSISNDLDLKDINAIRYQFRNDKKIAHFLDKYVIVTPDERNSYKEYAKEQDKLYVLDKAKQDKLLGRAGK